MNDVYTISTVVRNMLEELVSKDGYNMKWPALTLLIHAKIQEFKLGIVKPKSHYSQWTKIYNGTTSNSLSVHWWQEFEMIVRSIQADLDRGRNGAKSIIDILSQNNERIENPVRYQVWFNPDTSISKYFEASYNQSFRSLQFLPFTDWKDSWKAFAENKVDVALRDFATAIAYNSLMTSKSPLFFWPFFAFYGYGIFIKLAALEAYWKNLGESYVPYDEMGIDAKVKFLEQQSIAIERYTDFEWVLKDYCKNIGCDITVIEKNMLDINTVEGRTKFIYDDKVTMYVTNPVHIVELTKRPDLYLYLPSDKAHQNVNGLLCKEEYYLRNKPTIEKLIETWFKNIVTFQDQLKMLALNAQYRPPDFRPSHTMETLTKELNELTNSKLEFDDMPFLYNHSNQFYDHPVTAFNDFYRKTLNDPAVRTRYCEIAQIQLKNPVGDPIWLEATVRSIRDNMLKL